ncbi:phosphonate C-P lyase system protein PhnG [Herbivorax sp. ANBcel31]|uniref:phosphonate C-P lyase system protein PhnG n=1 Tax=Herbivorax sp. ANBcel31 TaxID=3069754 RepID=UPI0027B52319|nr:phosphonate C-P lyase system protein PhnG [Herbivorax sp. ANBcel31]MDQ2086740.1 phosphonate C-P lyase system protein PhnG [Herbivorax sp. ANBcel31]
MNKYEILKIMSQSPREIIIELAQSIMKKNEIKVIKKPCKIMVIINKKESGYNSNYKLKKIPACEAEVGLGEEKGIAVLSGDDLEKVLAMAVVDVAINAKIPESNYIMKELNEIKAM